MRATSPIENPNLSTEASLLVRVGTELFGDRWQSALARGMGTVPSALSMIASGDRPVTVAMLEALDKFLHEHQAHLRLRQAFISRTLVEMEANRNRELEPENEGPRFG